MPSAGTRGALTRGGDLTGGVGLGAYVTMCSKLNSSNHELHGMCHICYKHARFISGAAKATSELLPG